MGIKHSKFLINSLLLCLVVHRTSKVWMEAKTSLLRNKSPFQIRRHRPPMFPWEKARRWAWPLGTLSHPFSYAAVSLHWWGFVQGWTVFLFLLQTFPLSAVFLVHKFVTAAVPTPKVPVFSFSFCQFLVSSPWNSHPCQVSSSFKEISSPQTFKCMLRTESTAWISYLIMHLGPSLK